MTKYNYSIEDLTKQFSTHAEDFIIQNEKMKKMREGNFPDSDLPEFLNDPFNLSKALSVMCAEIERLKQIIGK